MRDLAHDLYPVYEPGAFPTCHATTDVQGKRLVRLTGSRPVPLGTLGTSDDNKYRVGAINAIGQWAVGVAKYDALANELVGVYAKPGAVVPIEAGAPCAFNDEVMADALGRVIPYVAAAGRFPIGRCMSAAGALGDDAEIKLYV